MSIDYLSLRTFVFACAQLALDRSDKAKVDTIELVNNNSYSTNMMYTLQGVQVKTYKGKGVYIVNGKKYINY